MTKNQEPYTYKDLIHLKSNFESYMVDRNSLSYYMSQTEVKNVMQKCHFRLLTDYLGSNKLAIVIAFVFLFCQ